MPILGNCSRTSRFSALLPLMLSLFLPPSVQGQTAPELVARAFHKLNGTNTSTPVTYSGSSWSDSVNVTEYGVTRAGSVSGSWTDDTVIANSSTEMNGICTISGLGQDARQDIAIYVKGDPSLTVQSNISGAVEINYASLGVSAYFGSVFGSDFVEIVRPSGAPPSSTIQTANLGESHSTFQAGNCAGSVTLPEYPGVKYTLVGGSSSAFTTGGKSYTTDSQGGLSIHSQSSGSTTFSIVRGNALPLNLVNGPTVSGVLTPNPAVGANVGFQTLSYDPDNQAGTTAGAGICGRHWRVTDSNGTVRLDNPAATGNISITVDKPGVWSVYLKVTDNEGDTSEQTVEFVVGPERGQCAGDGANCDEERSCASCTPDKRVTACVSPQSGKAQVTIDDPVATRGLPLSARIHVLTQRSPFAWLPRTEFMGDAAWTYGIQVTQGLKKIAGTMQIRWILIDADGAELDFGPAASPPARQAGIYSTLTQLGGGGYQLSGASVPEQLEKAGNYTYTFLSNGLLQSISDPSGNIQEITYNGSSSPTRVDDLSSAKYLEFELDGSGHITKVKENGGAAITNITYDSGRISQVLRTDSVGTPVLKAEIAYNSFGLPISIEQDDDSSSLITVAYEDSGYTFDYANLLYANGGGTKFDYFAIPASGMSYTVSRATASSGTIFYDYDSTGRLRVVRLPTHSGAANSPKFSLSYDSNFNLIQWKRGAGTSTAVTYNYTYSPLGLLASVNDGTGGVWSYSYAGADLTSVSDSVGTVATLTYTDASNPHSPTSITDGSSATWTRTYNSYGQVLTIAPPAGSPTGTSTFEYEENSSSPIYGYLKKVTNGAGEETTLDYTPLGDVASITTSPESGITNTTVFDYDAAQRVVSVTNPDSTTFETAYNGRNLDSTADEAGSITTFEFCSVCGKLTGRNDPLSRSVSWNYDTDSNLTGFVDGRAKSTAYTYGLAGELKKTLYPDSSFLDRLYDNFGRVSKVDNTRANRIELRYDGADRIDRFLFTSPSQTAINLYYFADGRIEHFTDAAGTYTYTYFPSRLLKDVTYNLTANGITARGKVAYTYNPDGTVYTLTWTKTYPSPTVTVAQWTYAYDAAGRMTSIANSFGETTSFTYDGEGKLVTQANQNGTSTTYSYNQSRGWPTLISNAYSGIPFAEYSLEYDGGANTVGNLTEVTELSGDTMTYQYDALYRLIDEERVGSGAYSTSYTYDLAGNIEQVNGASFATYDDGNKLSSLSGGSIAYDADGNVTAFTPSGGSASTHAWEHRSRMKQQVAGGVTYNYLYNALGHRAVRTAPGTRFYIFAGDTLLGELNGAIPDVAYTGGPDGLISRRALTGTPASHWYHFGPQGETRQLTNSAGAITDTYSYNAYGKLLSSSGSTSNPYRYGGKYGYYSEGTAKLMLATHRWYSPDLMRWMSRDPIEYDGGENLYEYVRGRPVSFRDSNGLAPLLNLSSTPVRYKPENEDGIVKYCGWGFCNVDAVYPDRDCDKKMPLKIPDNCVAITIGNGKIYWICADIRPGKHFPFRVDEEFLNKNQDWPKQ